MIIPKEIKTYLEEVFKAANNEVSKRLSIMPHTEISALNELFLSVLKQYAILKKFDSNWSIRVDSIFTGAGRHYYSWEIADIAVFILFRSRGKVFKIKVALLQSKKIYPKGLRKENDNNFRFTSLKELIKLEDNFSKILKAKRFNFNESCLYKGLKVKNAQWESINNYSKTTKIPVFYMFFNPTKIPLKSKFSENSTISELENEAGIRIIPESKMYETFKRKNRLPSYKDLKNNINLRETKDPEAGLRLEYFISEFLLESEEVYNSESINDEELDKLFQKRNGALQSAILINIETDGSK